MPRHITIIQGHPDPRGNHFGHALAAAYVRSAEEAGHEIRVINVAGIKFPLLQNKEEFEKDTPPDSILEAQAAIRWSDHLVIFYPLWLGSMPALLKGFLEQVFRPGFVTAESETGKASKKPLEGKTARIVMTMGMPAFIYRWFYRAHSLKNLERNVLNFCGIGPTKESLIGLVEAEDGARRRKWLQRMHRLGFKGA
jgi:putative NADPH-quinone reductase